MSEAKKLLKYNLQFFAEGSGGEKTEKATPKKREQAKKEGQVVKSIEVNTAILLIALFTTIKWIIPLLTEDFITLFRETYQLFDSNLKEFSISTVSRLLSNTLYTILKLMFPLFLVSVILGLVVNFIQVGFNFTLKPLQPKFNRLNPIQGFKRIFSLRAVFELIKSLIKIIIILLIVYSTIKGREKTLLVLYDMTIIQIIQWVGNLAIEIGIKIGMFFIFIAAADYLYQKYKHEKELKMTKQEIKEEYKMTEGNPEIKSKIRQKMREISLRRMIQELPKADVIITNPTHFSVAIQYDKNVALAPIVIAKGTDFLAARIKEKAKEHNIKIIENKQLARTLYYTVDIGDEIPPQLYQAVAEILAMIFSLKEK